jgi:hypothetical protein
MLTVLEPFGPGGSLAKAKLLAPEKIVAAGSAKPAARTMSKSGLMGNTISAPDKKQTNV